MTPISRQEGKEKSQVKDTQNKPNNGERGKKLVEGGVLPTTPKSCSLQLPSVPQVQFSRWGIRIRKRVVLLARCSWPFGAISLRGPSQSEDRSDRRSMRLEIEVLVVPQSLLQNIR